MKNAEMLAEWGNLKPFEKWIFFLSSAYFFFLLLYLNMIHIMKKSAMSRNTWVKPEVDFSLHEENIPISEKHLSKYFLGYLWIFIVTTVSHHHHHHFLIIHISVLYIDLNFEVNKSWGDLTFQFSMRILFCNCVALSWNV